MSKHPKSDRSGHGFKGVPMREWAAPSYDPTTGRAASSLEPPGTRTSHDRQHIEPNRQLPRDDAGFRARDLRATQDPTPVRKRPLG